MSDSYFALKGEGSGRYTEKMSRFLSFAIPVATIEEARSKVKEYQNEYHDSRHVCWATVVGASRSEWQINDDGEPSGTAGKPILGQINSAGLTDVLIVVVRYFGGIKLGTPGLIGAYREAARLAIEDAGIEERHEMADVSVIFPYVAADGVMKIAKSEGVEIVSRKFDNTCKITLRTRKDLINELRGRLGGLSGVSLVEDV